MHLTKSQQLIYDMEKYAGGTISVICGSMLSQGNTSIEQMQKAVNEIYRLNDALRIQITEKGREVNQDVKVFQEKEYEVLYFNNKKELDEYAEKYAKQALNLYGELCETKIVVLPDKYGVLVKLHHMVGDAWTLALLGNQFNDLMNGEIPVTYSYFDHIVDEDKYIQSKRYERDKTFFLEQFKSCDEPVWLSENRKESFKAKRKTYVIEKDRALHINNYIKDHNSSAFMLFAAALSTYMNRVKMNVEKFYMGTAVLNRSNAKEKNTAGMYVNTAPLLIELDNELSFAENLSKIEETAFGVFRHQKFNYGDVLAAIRKEYGFSEKLYDVMLSYQNASVAGTCSETTWYSCGMQTESLQYHIDDRDGEGIYRIHYDYLIDKFTEEEIDTLHSHIENIIFSAIYDDNKKLYDIDMLSEDEKDKVLNVFNTNKMQYPENECIHQLFEEQVYLDPEKTAIIAEDGELTYGQLNEQANRIAHYLVNNHFNNGIVAIALPRKAYLFAAMLGVLKSGAAYMPIDPNYPEERIQYMISESGAKLCITEENIALMMEGSEIDNLNREIRGEDIYCALHTSGSTGRPKMALLRHRNIRSFLEGNKRFWQDVDTVVSATIVTFDAFIMDSMLSMAIGCRVVLAKDEDIYNQTGFEKLFDFSKHNMFFATPTKLENYINNSSTKQFLSKIKSFVVGGEVFSKHLLEMIKNGSPESRVYNIYGPTEATICVLVDELEKEKEITIGYPVANTNIYILDKFMKPVPVGVTGELMIAGDSVGAGYVNQPELTEEKYIENPFGKGMMYKTGDLAYWREDGKIGYVGRNDFQVKIRGLRIELGEIENAICQVEGITQAVVVVRKNSEGRQIICAFYSGEEVDVKMIRSSIGKKLPKYMIPHIFSYLEEMPLTATGKISRTALPEVDLYNTEIVVEYVAPETIEEKVLIQAVSEVLGIEKISVLDNFFDIGGDSLKGIELISRVEAMGYHIDTKTIFDCETMKELSQMMTPVETTEEVFDYSGDIPASAAQTRVYTAWSMNPESTTYNVPYAFEAESVDVNKLSAAIQSLIDRHEILRTRFENRDGKIIQVIEEGTVCEIEKLETDDFTDFIRPFNLSKLPLMRVGYINNKVIIDMHHIITDGASMPVFLQELNEFYMGRSVNDKITPYKQFAVQVTDFTEDEEYWLSVFKDEVPVLEMNTDYKVDQKTALSGDALYDRIDISLHQKIVDKCKKINITPYVFYMTAYNILLSRYSGNDDIVIGMPISGRSSKYMNTLGMFVNTIALRNQPLANKNIKSFLDEVKENSVNAIAHQDYPYGELVKKVNLPVGRNTLFDVMFAYQSAEMTHVILGDKKAELLPIPVKSSKYDFTFNVMPRHDDVVIMVEYCDELYKMSTIQRLVNSYKLILSQLLDVDKTLKDINIITEEEHEKVKNIFNDTDVTYDTELLLHQMFEKHVNEHPNKTAIIASDATLTYEELNKMANHIANHLIKDGIKAGDIVAFALPRKSYLIAAMLGILKAGAAYLPIDPDYPQDRIDYMLEDSKAKIYISSENIEKYLTHENNNNPEVIVDSNGLCYCIYTSGSTGKPKAVAISHRNVHNFVIENSGEFQKAMKENCDCVFATNAVVFDITVQDIVYPLLNGLSVLFAETDTLTHVPKLLKYAPEGRTGLIITPTKLQMYMQSREFTRNLEKFSVIMVGAENFPQNLFRELRKYTDAIIFNGYGPTETTCGVLYARIEKNKKITIGKPIGNTKVYIVDSNMRVVPTGVTGELMIAGDSVGLGYLNRRELTDEKFIDNPFGEGRLYKTGDLAYWQEDGDVVYVGRNDNQVKIRGLRIELGEIENAISSMDNIIQSSVVVRKNREGRQVICAFYSGEEVDAREIRMYIGKTLPKYMIPHIFTHLDEMPMTAGGKVNQKALPEVDLYNTDVLVEYITPETDEEIVLAKEAAHVLGVERVGLLDNFFDLGGDSMKALELISRLENAGYFLNSKEIFESNTIKDLAEKIEEAAYTEEEFAYEGDIPATAAQMRVYTAQGMASDSTTYNVSFVFRANELDADRLQDAVDKLMKRHEILRTRFENKDGQIVQVVDEEAVCIVEKLENDDIESFIRPFDLSKAPLIRVGYYNTTVMVDIHHIVTDGSSMPVFTRELNEFYMGRELNKPTVPYKAFALQPEEYTESEKYWLSVYHDELPELELNTDFKAGQKQTFNGDGVYDMISAELNRKITAKCKELGITPYVYYMSAFNVMLTRFSGGEDIIVGMPISGRSSRFLNTIGMFVNTIALRNKPIGSKSVKDFMLEVKENSIQAIAHQDYPFGELVKKLNIAPGGKNPLFDVMLAYQSEEMTEVIFGDEKAELLPLPVTSSKYDLTLSVLPQSDKVVLMAEYCTDLYRESTIKRFLSGYKNILVQMLDVNKQIKDVRALTEDDRNHILIDFNCTQKEYERGYFLHRIFEEQVFKMPEKCAIIAPDQNLTYNELNIKANMAAHSLIEAGVVPGDIVAFALPRNSNMIAVILGILKAGACYLPVDPDYPQDRIDYMIADSKAKLFITQENVSDYIENEKKYNPNVEMDEEALCYCIYTSGSTGKPKGTLLKHKGITNLVLNLELYDDMSECERIGLMTTITFDVASQEIFTALLNGMTGVLMSERRETKTDTIIQKINEHNVDIIYGTTTYVDSLTNSEEKAKALAKSVKKVVLAGEAFAINEHLANTEGVRFYNQYGPAETHVATASVIDNLNDIHIGGPIANTQIYILDTFMNPTPIGVTGELCIAGDCVGAGYLNRPELNKEKFVKNPFGKGKLYKTGDLAFWREDGNIAYIGRNDFQVKIRGQRIELGEIESAMCSMENIAQAVVVVRKNKEGRQMICAFYTGEETDVKDIRRHIGKKLPKYMVPHIFTWLEVMPLTASGKISRTALPEVDLYNADLSVEYVAPENEAEMILAECTCKVLGVSKVGMLDNFFDLGGDSLKGIELISKLEAEGYVTDTKSIFECDTMKELAATMEVSEYSEEDFNYEGDIPATSAQMRIYTAQSMNADITSYNVPYIFKVADLDVERLQNAVDKLIERHDIFRTWFKNNDGQIIQVIEENAECKVEAMESDDLSKFIRPFDLSIAPLIRVGYYENIVMIDIHHIITDGGSMPVFLHELNELYMGRELNTTPVPYKLFAIQKPDYSASKDYWLSVFHDEPPVLEMNTDFMAGQKQSFNGNALYEVVKPELYHQILDKTKELGITPYVFYMSAFNILLSKYSANEDIVVGMPMSGRSGRFMNTLGMFVNTIALRNKPEGDKKIKDFLNEVKENSVNAIAHQDYPYGELVKKLNLGTTGRNPLFDVMFAYQSEETSRVIFGDKEAELLPMPVTTSKYDFTFNILPKDNHAIVMVEYCTDLYKENTMQRLAESYKNILEQMLDEGQMIKDVSAMTNNDMQRVLNEFNDTYVEYSENECLHHLFENNARINPDNIAVIADDATLTYKQMNECANRFANALVKADVKSGDIVAVALPRRSYLIAAILGVLKAGAAYMPIDPNYPQERIAYMLKESSAKLCITEEIVAKLLEEDNIENPDIKVMGDDLYCALHTSGSTGTPKMALLNQKGLRSFLTANQRFWEGIDTVVSATIVTFDAFIMDSVLSMAQGVKVILAKEDDIYNQSGFEKLFEYSENNMFFSTPTKIENYISTSETKQFLSKIKSYVIGGEVFNEQLLNLIKDRTPESRVYNIYGPTEATICALVDELEKEKLITIGKPIGNTQIYIVDQYMMPVPIGVTGELCIGGDGVGNGYINRPDMTAEKFIDNPFGEGTIYKTGDLAYWREDGSITYVGRNDFQVKIRGLRIELGEIESAICTMDDIIQSVVVVRKNQSGRQIICAFYTGEEVEAKEMRLHIGKRLPKYMVPHVFSHLDEMPLTSSGKIDRKALPDVDLENIVNEQEYVPPKTNLQIELCKMLEDILDIKPVGLADDFFELGGDSLKAIEFVSRAHNEGIYFNLQNVFDYTTVEQLTECIENGDDEMIRFDDIDFTAIDHLLEGNRNPNVTIPKKKDMGNILLSGATGYMGIHILASYLEKDNGTAYCLVRGKDIEESENRLKTLLRHYFGNRYQNTDRIKVICADLVKENMGIHEEEYAELISKINTVIHTAASVKHYGSYKYFYEANVESTKQMIAFALKADANMIHTSTLSVSGVNLNNQHELRTEEDITYFYEDSFYVGQKLDNVYTRSKFEAELAVYQAMINDGLKANIMRMGNLTNRRSDGMFQKNHESNAFLQRIKAILDLGVVPDYMTEYYSEFTPIDEAAEAVMTLTRHFSMEHTVFHITNVKVIKMLQLGEIFCKLGFNLEAVNGNRFTETLINTTKQKGKEYIFEAFINDMDENNQLDYNAGIHTANTYTAQYLSALGFEWREIDFDYLKKYVSYFKNIGYLEGRDE